MRSEVCSGSGRPADDVRKVNEFVVMPRKSQYYANYSDLAYLVSVPDPL